MSAVAPDEASVLPEPNGLRSSVFLMPIAAPSVLGYYAAASGFLIFGVWFAGSLGAAKSAVTMFPFLLLFSGIGQLAAGLWSLRARDAAQTSLFSIWGGFWIGYGLLWLVEVLGGVKLPPFGHGFVPLGEVFIYIAAITWTVAFAALARSPLQFASQAIAALAATLSAVGLTSGSAVWQQAAGWAFVAASALFYYHASATMINALLGRVVLPHLSWRREENVLGSRPLQPIQFDHGESGVKVGQ